MCFPCRLDWRSIKTQVWWFHRSKGNKDQPGRLPFSKTYIIPIHSLRILDWNENGLATISCSTIHDQLPLLVPVPRDMPWWPLLHWSETWAVPQTNINHETIEVYHSSGVTEKHGFWWPKTSGPRNRHPDWQVRPFTRHPCGKKPSG